MSVTLSTSHSSVQLPSAGLTGLLVGGEWETPSSGDTFVVENPSRRTVVAEVGLSGPTDVDRAVASARAAFGSWKVLPSRARGAMLTSIAERLAEHSEEIARLLAAETGNALRTQSRGEVQGAVEVFRYYGGVSAEQKGETLPLGDAMLSYSTREPLGVVGAIIPWNSPVVLGAVKIAMALVTGNTIVLKPAEDAPLAVLRMVEIAQEILPAGVLNVVTGPGSTVGAALANHEDVNKVSFTGSSEVGRSVSHAVADRIGRATLELGGKSPTIVFPDAAENDADVDALVSKVVGAMRFARQGQSCTAGSRLFLHESLWSNVMPKLVAAVEALEIGDALDEGSEVGAVISEERYSEIRSMLIAARDAGAVFETGEVPPPASEVTGLFPEPVILTGVDNRDPIAQQEVFGPVLVVIPWTDEAEVIRQANDTPYGLAAYVFTRDTSTALRVTAQLEAGWIQVNQAGGQIAGMSYGGMKQSGIGSEYSIEGALEAYTTRKSVTVSLR